MSDERHESDVAREVRRQLVELVRSNGPGILDDTRRVRAMLADAVRGATAEANLVGLALSSGVPDRLREAGPDPVRVRQAVEATAQDLERTSSVQSSDALWATSAIAEAMGLHSSATLRPVPAGAAAPAFAAGGSPAGGGSDDLVIRVGDREVVAAPGDVVTIGREPGSTLMLDSPAVSRRHARLQRGAGGWEYQDVGSTQGSFVNGMAVTTMVVSGETEVILGQGPDSLRIRLVPFGTANTQTPRGAQRPAAPATEVGGMPPRPGGALGRGPAPRTELGGADAADQLSVTLGATTRTVAPGAVLTIGREADNDLVTTSSTTSRHHARIEHGAGGWQLHDLGSTSGTWVDGRRTTQVRLQGRQEVVLGDVERGDRLVTSTSGTSRPAQTAGTGRRRTGLLVAAGVGATALLVVLGLVIWNLVDDPAPVETSGGVALTRDDLARATVLLDTDPATGSGEVLEGGSGVIIDREAGLILTNAHVAAPSAVGRGIATLEFADQQQDDPERILVHVSTGLDESAEPRFYAEVVAVDGYLDLAVLQIDRKVSGAPVEEADLADLVEVPLGDSDELSSADEISFIGYPEAAQSKAPTFTTGVVSGPVQDDRLDEFRAAINTTATSSFGNSGGLAMNEAGEMVGVPTWGRRNVLGDVVFSSIRPINMAMPIIQAARSGEKYTSPWAVRGPAGAKVVGGLRYGEAGPRGEVAAGCQDGPRSLAPLAIAVRYAGLPGGGHTDVLAVLYDATGAPVSFALSEYATRLPKKGCMTLTFSRDVAPGSYDLTIGVGGDLRVVYDGEITLP